MKVGIFTDTYLPDINGVATSSQILRNTLTKHGHEVVVVTTEVKKGMEYEDEGTVLRLSGIELKNLYDYRLASLFSLKKMKQIKEMKLDVIHVQTEFSVGIFGKIVAHLLNIPLVYTYHTQYEDYVHYAPVIGKIEPFQPILKKAVSVISQFYGDDCTELISPSEKTKTILENYGINKEIHVIPTGLELDRFERKNLDEKHLEEIKKECGINDNTFSILFLGRIAPEKSVDLLIDAIYHLKEDGKSVRLVIVGGGPGVDALIKQANELGVGDSIYFAGPKLKNEVPYYYYACDVFASASTSETQGLTYIEAQAASLPILARYDKNLDDIILEGRNGYFFTDALDMAKKVEMLLTLDLGEFKKNAYQHSRNFSSVKFYDQIIEVYEKANSHKKFNYQISEIIVKEKQLCDVVLKMGRHNITISIPESYLVKHNYEVGTILDHSMLEELQAYEMVFKGYNQALKLLTYKDYTKKQMYDKLESLEDYNQKQITTIISLLEERRLIDDVSYCESYMRKANRTGMGIRKALKKLREAGIEEEILVGAREMYSREIELEKAKEIVEKFYKTNKSKSKQALLHAIKDKLFYNGYDTDVIDEAIDLVPIEISDQFENELLEREIDKAYRKYEKRYEGYELKKHIISYLTYKGFEYAKIKNALNERGIMNDFDD